MLTHKPASSDFNQSDQQSTLRAAPQAAQASDSSHDNGNQSRRENKKKHEYRGQMLNRWPRALARLFELSWQMPLVLTGLLMLTPDTFTNNNAGDPIVLFLLAFISLPIALLLDALISGIFGNTPAKAIIGVKAVGSRGERLYMGKHLRRNIGVWTDGLGLGVFPISIFTMFRQYTRVSGRRETIYDEKLHIRVRSGRFTALRVIILLLLMIAAFGAVMFYGA